VSCLDLYPTPPSCTLFSGSPVTCPRSSKAPDQESLCCRAVDCCFGHLQFHAQSLVPSNRRSYIKAILAIFANNILVPFHLLLSLNMSSPREDRYYGSQTKSRMSRSPPGGDPQNSGVFQTGQGGRTVLPPISSAFPTSHFPGLFFSIVSKVQCAQIDSLSCVVPGSYASQYPQQQYSQLRSSPGRTDHNSVSYGGQWTNNNPGESIETRFI
jgi:hypothetical protein